MFARAFPDQEAHLRSMDWMKLMYRNRTNDVCALPVQINSGHIYEQANGRAESVHVMGAGVCAGVPRSEGGHPAHSAVCGLDDAHVRGRHQRCGGPQVCGCWGCFASPHSSESASRGPWERPWERPCSSPWSCPWSWGWQKAWRPLAGPAAATAVSSCGAVPRPSLCSEWCH